MKYPVTPVAILIICCLFIAGASAIPVIVGFKEMPRAGAISPGGTLMTASGNYPDVPEGAIAIPEIGRLLPRPFLNFSLKENFFSLIAVFMAKTA